MKTKLIKQLSILLITAAVFVPHTYAEDNQQISVIIDGKTIAFEQPPVVINDRTMVPLRAIFEALGADVHWDGDAHTVRGIKGQIRTIFKINDSIYYINTIPYFLDSPLVNINGRTLVPVRVIAESFGCDVAWDGDTKTVSISSKLLEEMQIDYEGQHYNYYGEIKNGKANGYGIRKNMDMDADSYSTERIAIGQFENNDFVSGSRYVGQWEFEGFRGSNYPIGQGILYLANGIQYEGRFNEGYNGRLGQGIIYFPSGNKYEGEWEDYIINGYGVAYFANGERYEGEWIDGKFYGNGVFYHNNGDRYEGEFQKGLRHGKGTYYRANGEKFGGSWVYDEWKGGNCIIYYADGGKYEGSLYNGMRLGRGVYYRPDGTVEKGIWDNDILLLEEH